jgi:hypothetical protein
MLGTLLNKINGIRTDLLYAHSDYRKALSDLPLDLYSFWHSTASLEFKGIPRDAFFFARAAEGLMMFFDCVRHSGRPCGLPSKAADSVWHAWARLDPGHLSHFCIKHFGRAIAHTEGPDMSVPIDDALANGLVAARGIEALPAAGANLPRLFSLDRRLRMPDGYAYSLASGQVAYRAMNWQGSAKGDLFFPAVLAPVGLLAAGLISQEEYGVSLQRAHPDGSGCGAGCGSTTSDGGAACGSSCGGGCGGGCGS